MRVAIVAAGRRALARRLAVALASALAGAFALPAGCSRESGGDGDPGERWPLLPDVSGVVGYAVLPARGEQVARALEGLVGWAPRGLPEEAALGLVWLDRTMLGGEYALVLPTTDGEQLRDSLFDAPTIEVLDEDRFRLSLPSNHPTAQFLLAVLRLAGAASPADVLGALRAPPPLSWDMELRLEGGQAVLSPSYEAAIVVRRLLDAVPGLAELQAMPSGVRLAVDATALRLAYRSEIDDMIQQLRGALSGYSMLGAGAMLMGLHRDSGGDEPPDFPLAGLNGPLIWTLLDMLDPESLEGAALALDGLDSGPWLDALSEALGGAPSESEPADAVGTLSAVGLRLRWSGDAPLARLLDGLRPATELPGSASLGFDPQRFPVALSAWLVPLIELAQGEGPPATALEARLAELLAPLAGTLVASLEPGALALAAPLQPGQDLDILALQDVFEQLARAAHLEPDEGFSGLSLREQPPEPGESVAAGTCWTEDELICVTLAPAQGAALEQFLQALRDAPRGDAASLCVSAVQGWDLAGFTEGGELSLELDLPEGLFDADMPGGPPDEPRDDGER